MSEQVYKTIFQFKRGSTAEWESVNPILREGEPGWDTTVKKQKIGDGKTAWKDLSYENDFQVDIINCGNATI